MSGVFDFWFGDPVARVEAYKRDVRLASTADRDRLLRAVAACGGREVGQLKELRDRRDRTIGGIQRQRDADLAALKGATTKLVNVMVARWDDVTIKRGGYTTKIHYQAPTSTTGGLVSKESVAEVVALATATAAKIEHSYMALISKSKAGRDFDRECVLVNGVLARLSAVEQRVSKEAVDGLAATTASATRSEVATVQALSRAIVRSIEVCAAQPSLAQRAVTKMAPPTGIAEGLSNALASCPRGDGRFLLQAGWAVMEAPTIRVGSDLVSGGAPVHISAFLDLDTDGGLITNSRTEVNSLSRRMLATLPAGQLQFKVFDPKGLGKSVRDLFAVDEVSSKVLPDKVFSTRRELEELLEKLERMLTDVYRKYLGAKHKTLHEYNLAAGEVSEPYRLLLIYDYPSGWDRGDGQVDRDLEARLAKVIEAGPACGLFTLIHSTGATGAGYRLPRLFIGAALDASAPALSRMLGTPIPEVVWSNPADDTFINAAREQGPGALVSWGQRITWKPPGKDDVEPGALGSVTRSLAVAIKKSAAVSVSASKVADLARQKGAAAARSGLGAGDRVADPSDPRTWWCSESQEKVVARFGRLGATDVAELAVDSGTEYSWLIAGQPGSGKSVLLHAAITDLIRSYSPAELELWLADLKFGVEFRAYAEGALPHARVVGLEAGREFGLDMLNRLVDEIGRRAGLFKAAGSVVNLRDYRAGGGHLPRVVAVIDEFHGLFERDDRLAQDAATAMESILRLGRAFGVHLLLATQQISAGNLPKRLFDMVSCRIALLSSQADSAAILGNESNTEASELTRPGEGVLNKASSGSRDANQRFQAIHVQRQEVVDTVAACSQKATSRGFTRKPIVMDSSVEVRMDRADVTVMKDCGSGLSCNIPLGRPMGMGPTTSLHLDRAPGSNVLLVAQTHLSAAILGQLMAAAFVGGLSLSVLDLGGLGSELSQALDHVAAAAQRHSPPKVDFRSPREFQSLLAQAATEVGHRSAAGHLQMPPQVVVFANVNRCPALGVDDQDRLAALLRDGPEVGVHTLVHVSSPKFIDRFLDYDTIGHMGIRIVGALGPDDSERWTGSAFATHLVGDQAVLAVPSMGEATTVRVFRIPPSRWAGLK